MRVRIIEELAELGQDALVEDNRPQTNQCLEISSMITYIVSLIDRLKERSKKMMVLNIIVHT